MMYVFDAKSFPGRPTALVIVPSVPDTAYPLDIVLVVDKTKHVVASVASVVGRFAVLVPFAPVDGNVHLMVNTGKMAADVFLTGPTGEIIQLEEAKPEPVPAGVM